MTRPARLATLALAAALLLAACSGSSSSPTTTTSAPTADGNQVVIDSFAFTPTELTVAVGTTVTWVNHHAARHDVVADGGAFASPLFGTGETFSFTFETPGEYPYHCSIHSGMTGVIVVTP